MNKNRLLIVLLSFVLMQLNAQNDTIKMSLQQCIDYALKNSATIKNISIDEEIAKARIKEIRAIGLPQINATAGIQHNLRLRDFFLLNNTGEAFGTQLPPQSLNKEFRIPNLFQLPNAIDGSVSFTQIIFSNSYLIGLKAAKVYAELANKNSIQSKSQVVSAVTKAYYLTIISTERMKLFDANITRLDSTFNQMGKMNKQGFVEQIDAQRLEVTLNNLKTEREKTNQLLALSGLSLKFQMGMPLETNLQTTENISEISISENDIQTSNIDKNNRPEYMQLTAAKRLQELDLKNQKSAYLPTLALTGDLGVFTSANSLGGVITGKDFYSIDGKGRWATYGVVTLGLKIPIFDGFARSARVQQSSLNMKKINNNVALLENSIDLQVKSAEVTLKNSIKTVEMQKKNMALAENVATISRKKYALGMGSNLEVTTAESALKEAQVNYYNALFDVVSAKVDFDLATGNLK